ncbi:MAG: ankyrin repeat domain-containing protein [Polyangiales bacterium]
MRVLTYADLALGEHGPAFEKVRAAIERDDFRSADVKKLNVGPYHRAKLDHTNRLLLQFLEHAGTKVCLALELIENHGYDRSRFLRGASVDEAKIEREPAIEAPEPTARARYVHPDRAEFHLLDKPISFDDAQDRIYRMAAPLVLVGSAGSGKTALTLAKMRRATGAVLYVTQSSFLAQSARAQYFAHGYETETQEPEFLSHRDLLDSIAVPPGKPVTFREFRAFFERHRPMCKFTDAHQCFEELRGVIGAQPEGPLSLDAYQALGVRQSIFGVAERAVLHALFEKYRQFLESAGLYDSNLVSQAYRARVEPRYDFVVVDEVQDLTNAELALVLATLRRPGQFLLCGDANQIVHPNFFSWSGVKSLFFRDAALAERHRIELLDVNFRNARAVTRAANRLLRIKHARFGSIDQESTALVRPVADEEGSVSVLPADDATIAELGQRTARSARVAVLVLRDEDKEQARRLFRTPLLFSLHEAKGLEYESVILHRFVSSERAAFADLCEGITEADLGGDELSFRRAKDQGDQSLEVQTFFVNALYVALTRGVRNVWMVESDVSHPLLRLLDVKAEADAAGVSTTDSGIDEWQREARRLELQGKQEQAEAIRRSILRTSPVPWQVIDDEGYRALSEKSFAPRSPFTKAKLMLYEWACTHGNRPLAEHLHAIGFVPAERFAQDAATVAKRQLAPFAARSRHEVLALVDRHGVDYRTPMGLTALMAAAAVGNLPLVDVLLERGARRDLVDPYGRTAMHWALREGYASETFARQSLGPVWDRVAIDAFDIQVDGRAFKIARDQAEFFYLTATTLAWHELQASRHGRSAGISTAALSGGAFESFPHEVVTEKRKKRTYLNHLFARNEIGSSYTPNRKLWRRERNGHYVPNPALLVRTLDAQGDATWRPFATTQGEAHFQAHWLANIRHVG